MCVSDLKSRMLRHKWMLLRGVKVVLAICWKCEHLIGRFNGCLLKCSSDYRSLAAIVIDSNVPKLLSYFFPPPQDPREEKKGKGKRKIDV